MTKKRKFNRAEPVMKRDSVTSETDCGRGAIKDNALKAVVTSKLFTTRIVQAKKGKGCFQRKEKHKGRESYSIAA